MICRQLSLINGFRLFFYANERNEPAHVHVDYHGAQAKFWIEPVSLVRNLGMTASELGKAEDLVVKVDFTADSLCLHLADGREIRVPLAFYPRLKNATKAQRENYQVCGMGTGIHWPDVDEDLSVEGIVAGRPARF